MSAKNPANSANEASSGTALDVDRVREDLEKVRLGTRFHYFPEIDSTNAQARQLAENGAAEGEVVIAESQSQGRGRLGRRWQSPPFVNLYLSVILRPRLPPIHVPQLTLMGAVALADTAAAFISQAPAIKWPNDILVNGKKLAGILTEASCDAERVNYVILGIGVNLNYRVDRMPEEIRARATSIVELTRQEVNRESFLSRLIQDLDRCYGELEEAGFAAIARQWEARCSLSGRRVRVESLDQVVLGRAQGIDRDGALLVEDDHGKVQRVIAGDVIPLET